MVEVATAAADTWNKKEKSMDNAADKTYLQCINAANYGSSFRGKRYDTAHGLDLQVNLA